MLIKKPDKIRPSEITDKQLFKKRRKFIRHGAGIALGLSVPTIWQAGTAAEKHDVLGLINESGYTVDEDLTSLKAITSYNNFYEFALDKESPAELAKNFKTRPWTINVDGECEKPKVWDIDELLKLFALEERTYRLRCVEAWSMVIPWIGLSLGEFIKHHAPTSKAKYVRFETLHDPEQMPNQKPGLFGPVLNWPYVEGLRIDEATHPLTILAVGLYGDVLPNQNGAPIRLVVPWKYGFKSIKSVVRISFSETQPLNTWQEQIPHEYGFYANVNPEVHHPRWSQAQERRIGEWLKRPTLMFNGYAEDVAHLYSDMDLTEHY